MKVRMRGTNCNRDATHLSEHMQVSQQQDFTLTTTAQNKETEHVPETNSEIDHSKMLKRKLVSTAALELMHGKETAASENVHEVFLMFFPFEFQIENSVVHVEA